MAQDRDQREGRDMDYAKEIADTEHAVIEAAIAWYHAVRAGNGEERGEAPGLVDVVGALLSLRGAAGVTTSTDNRTPPWRSLRHDPLCHQHERVWVAGPRLPTLPKFTCLEINPRPAEYWRGLGFTHWMPLEDWPLPPAPEGDA